MKVLLTAKRDEENEDDDGLPNTYDYNDSFIDDCTQRDSESDSEFDDSEDIRDLKRDAKKFIKNKKLYQK